MANPEAERVGEPGEPRELRLEGFSLLVAAGVLAALLFGAFQLGRWTERRSAPAAASGSSTEDILGHVERPAEGTPPTVFDTVSEGREAEPRREASHAEPPPTAAPSPPPVLPQGPWTVQVFAGRDREAAEQVLQTLQSRGYPARLEASREGQTALYRVRVGGYPSREAAEAAAERLRREGMTSTWVTSR